VGHQRHQGQMQKASQKYSSSCWNNASQLQLHLNHVDQRGHRRTARLNDKVGGFAIQRIALRIQIPQAAQGVGYLQQRPLRIMPKAPEQLVGRRAQVNHMGSFMQVLPVCRAQNYTTTRRQHTPRVACELVNDRLLYITKSRLTLPLEVLTDRAAKLLLYHMIRVKNRDSETPGKLSADGRFS
jgi:hypothetical protein